MGAWIRGIKPFLLALLIWPLLGGCQASAQVVPVRAEPVALEEISLGIVGYNYTNRSINAFSVNGNGGGNLFVSSPTSGGGGTTCCVPYFAGVRHMKLDVKWQYGGCRYHVKSSTSDELYERTHHFFKEASVDVEPPFPANPHYVEIHFYPDGGVKAFITETESAPRLGLPATRADRSPYPRCPDDKKPSA